MQLCLNDPNRQPLYRMQKSHHEPNFETARKGSSSHIFWNSVLKEYCKVNTLLNATSDLRHVDVVFDFTVLE